MTNSQILITAELLLVLALFAWGRWRHDLVAISALLAAVLLGLVPMESAFDGFSHPAVITVAAVLVVSHALNNSGVVDLASRHLGPLTKQPLVHLATLTAIVTVASAFMNNVGALALLLPVAMATAREHGRSPALVLMPMAFGSILGGMTTLIGTPPNIIIAGYRSELTGESFQLFDFSAVGLPVAVLGVLFIVLFGWRLIPRERREATPADQLFEVGQYLTELRVPEDSNLVGKQLDDLEPEFSGNAEFLGLARAHTPPRSVPGGHEFRPGDILVTLGSPEDLKPLLDSYGLELLTTATPSFDDSNHSRLVFMEGVVSRESSLAGRDVSYLRRRTSGTVALVGIARQGQTLRKRLRRAVLKSGDVLLLQGGEETLPQQIADLGLLPLAPRDLSFVKPQRALIALLIFALAIASVLFNWMPISVAFMLAVLIYLLLGILPVNEVYQAIDWPIIVLLGAMLPVGNALEISGTTQLLAELVVSHGDGLPVYLLIAMLMIVTMFLSDIINNAATVVVMAPIGVGMANQLGAPLDPFLMAVAVGASCAFLTPIGHQSNTLVMGPGGYRFGDYWRMGLPLEILIVVIAVPAIMFFWPPFA